MCFVCTEERSIVVKSAFAVNLCRCLTERYQFVRGKKPFNGDIFPNGRTGCLFKGSAKLRFADKKPIAYYVEIYVFGIMTVDVLNYVMYRGVFRVFGVFTLAFECNSYFVKQWDEV